MIAQKIESTFRPLAICVGLLFVATAMYEMPLEDRLASYPRHAVGTHLIAYDWKGATVYITPSDNTQLTVVHAVFAVTGLIFVPYIIARVVARRSAP